MASNPFLSKWRAPTAAWFAGTLNAATAAAVHLQQLFLFFPILSCARRRTHLIDRRSITLTN